MKSSQEVKHLLILAIVCWFAFFHNNSAQKVGIMEARNLVTAHEMVEYNNWIVPTMNGELRLEKPPLPTWIAAIVEIISPDNIALQRGIAGCMAILLVYFLYLMAFALSKDRTFAFISSLILSTSLYVVIMGRTATWDIYCHTFMLMAIYYLYNAFHKEGSAWKEFVLSGIFMGLSFLSKGPVAFFALLLPFLISFIVVYKPSLNGKIKPILVMITIMLILSFWWPVYLYFNHIEEAMYVAQKESTAWVNHNVKPWYRYLSFPVQSGLWTIFLTISLIFPYAKNRFEPHREYRFMMIWTLMAVFLLSLFPEKKERYLFPVLIPAACCVAFYLSYIFRELRSNRLKRYERLVFNISVLIPTLLCYIAPLLVYMLFYSKGDISILNFVFVSISFITLGILLSYGIVKKRKWFILCGLIGIMLIAEAGLFRVVTASLDSNKSEKIIVLKNDSRFKNIPFYTLDENLRIEVVYLLGKRILYWDIEKENLPNSGLPFVLISSTKPEENITEEMRNKYDIEFIGVYDNNRVKKGKGKYRKYLVTYVSLFNEKK